jgi:hypothetical protein
MMSFNAVLHLMSGLEDNAALNDAPAMLGDLRICEFCGASSGGRAPLLHPPPSDACSPQHRRQTTLLKTATLHPWFFTAPPLS